MLAQHTAAPASLWFQATPLRVQAADEWFRAAYEADLEHREYAPIYHKCGLVLHGRHC